MRGPYLKDVIEALEALEPSRIIAEGFGRPHSYRGDYYDCAFVPIRNVTVGEMLKAVKSAVGATFEGWKGGDYKMDLWSVCWLAERGECGETLGPRLLDYMLGVK